MVTKMVVDVGIVKNHIKPKADSTLRNMRKDDLIEYIRCLENNYNVAVSFNESQANYIESLDVSPVVHGRWIIEKRHTVSRNPYMDDNYHAHATCSECNFCIDSSNASFDYPKMNTTNYCPNCGAKMDGERKDNE